MTWNAQKEEGKEVKATEVRLSGSSAPLEERGTSFRQWRDQAKDEDDSVLTLNSDVCY